MKSKTLIGFLIIVGFFLITEHRTHLFGVLPYLLFLACPLMHCFHRHGGHGCHGGHDDHIHEKRDSQEKNKDNQKGTPS